MEIKNLEKAKDLLEEIKDLDEKIIKLDQFGLKIFNNEISPSFKLKASSNEDDDKKVFVDTDGYDPKISFYQHIMGAGILGQLRKGEESKNLELASECSPELCLEIINVILNAARARREFLIRELQKLGFKI